MSYCRWGSDFGRCDVYVYEDVGGGWTTHVAGRRLKHEPPAELIAMRDSIDWQTKDAGERFYALHMAEQAWRDSLPCDEVKVNYAQPDGTTKPGVMRTPKDSEYLDLRTIGPEAGDSFNDGTPGECADRLESLRAKGFNVPQHAIDALREEQRESPPAENYD